MKRGSILPLPYFFVLGIAACTDGWAALRIKQNNTDNLNLASSWDVLPVAADTVRWDATVMGPNTVSLGANTTWAGLQVTNPGGPVTLQGANTLAAGFVTVDAGASLTLANGTSTLNFSGLSGGGILVIDKGASNSNLNSLNTADSLAFTGTLRLRGGNATTSAGTVSTHWLMLGASSLSQLASTAFALDTGASTANAKDFILTDAWSGKTLTLSSPERVWLHPT